MFVKKTVSWNRVLGLSVERAGRSVWRWVRIAENSKIEDFPRVQDVFRVEGLFQPLKHFNLVGIDVHREKGFS